LRLAVEIGCLFAIDTDAHAPGQLDWLDGGCVRAELFGIEPDRGDQRAQRLSHDQTRQLLIQRPHHELNHRHGADRACVATPETTSLSIILLDANVQKLAPIRISRSLVRRPSPMLPTEDLFVYVYVLIHDLVLAGAIRIPHRPGPVPACSDAELLAIAEVRHLLGRRSESGFLAEVARDWGDLFPALPCQSEANRRPLAVGSIRAAQEHARGPGPGG
ncbi:MAG: Mobile element protein, partial [Actinomycetia bacterium]|nr:Mobile element protein [Actinomycetes bacterium]